MPEVRLTLPLPPSSNHRYLRRRDGGLALTRQARDYDLAVWEALGQERPCVPVRVPVEMRILLVVDHRRRRDLDNVLKQVLDSVARCLGFDDAWVDGIAARKTVDLGSEPEVRVIVEWREDDP